MWQFSMIVFFFHFSLVNCIDWFSLVLKNYFSSSPGNCMVLLTIFWLCYEFYFLGLNHSESVWDLLAASWIVAPQPFESFPWMMSFILLWFVLRWPEILKVLPLFWKYLEWMILHRSWAVQRVNIVVVVRWVESYKLWLLARTSGFVAFATSLKHRYLHCFMLPKAVLTDLRSTLRTCANLLVFAVFSQLPRQKMRSRPTLPHILQSMFLKTLQFVFKVLRNGLLRYILYTCPNLM